MGSTGLQGPKGIPGAPGPDGPKVIHKRIKMWIYDKSGHLKTIYISYVEIKKI